jgi:hypothetical protein
VFDPFARHTLAKAHHIGLKHSAAVRAGGHHEPLERQLLAVAIAVGCCTRRGADPVRVASRQIGLQGLALHQPRTAQAARVIDPAVRIDDLRAAGGLVQAVDVLRDQQLDPALALEAGQRGTRGIRSRAVHAWQPARLWARQCLRIASLPMNGANATGAERFQWPCASRWSGMPESVLQPAPVGTKSRRCVARNA